MDCLAGAVEGDNEGEADCYFCGGDGDYEEDEDLAVVVRQAGGAGIEAGECDEGKICGREHELETHEDDDDVTAHDDAGEAYGEEQAGDEQVIVERGHGGRANLGGLAFR